MTKKQALASVYILILVIAYYFARDWISQQSFGNYGYVLIALAMSLPLIVIFNKKD